MIGYVMVLMWVVIVPLVVLYCGREFFNSKKKEEPVALELDITKLRNGSRVRIIKNSSSRNVVGDVGIISDWEQYRKNFTYRVNVKGRKDFGNWQNENHIEVLEY